MEKTININLGGTLFSIDEDAYQILKDYLNAIDQKFRNVPGGNETIEDIEFRIAEIFQSQRGNAGVIAKENVESMIAIIGRPEDFDQVSEETPHRQREYHRGKKMYRNPDDRIIGGVCGGIGTYLNTDSVWIRILFVVFAFFFLFGLFVYLALWLALPSAENETQKKEMYGSNYSRAALQDEDQRPYQTTSGLGNAANAVFRALGKACFIVIRIILIAFGTCILAGGFLALLAFIMVFIFKYPGAFSTDVNGIDLSYAPDFLNYIISAGLVPYVKALIMAVVAIPMLALIYGGIRLIFWFRARDGVVWLTGLIVWVLCIAALSIMLFNEGVGYGDFESTTVHETMKTHPGILYISSGRKISDLKTDNEIIIPEEFCSIYISDEKKELYTKVNLDIFKNDEEGIKVEVVKRSAGRNRRDAVERSGRLLYNYSFSGDTLFLDEFFTVPADTRWSFDNVFVRVFAPEGTVIHMDKTTESQYHSIDDDFAADSHSGFWSIGEDGPEYKDSVKKAR